MFSGYKTVVFNVVLALVAVVKAFNPDAPLPDAEEISTGIDGFLLALGSVWGIGNIILRAVTSSPIFTPRGSLEDVTVTAANADKLAAKGV